MQAVATHSAAPAVTIYNGIPTVLSTNIADVFGKRHDHVLRDIESILKTTPEERLNNFIKINIEKPANLGNGVVKYRAYALTKEGFTFLAMGFTGTKAAQFKWAYIDEFKRMEEALRAPTDQSALITTTEQYEIRKAIKSRAKNSSVHYQTVYNALYDYFKIASYKDLRHDQMKAALTLIETCTLKPQLPAPTLAEGSVILSAQEAEALLTFIYYVRFLFADVFGKLDGLLRIVDSPLAGSFWDAFHEVSWGRILEILAKHGHDINDMPCYQHWSSCQPKRKAA
ncbi:Rha family transcriptional regulator [Sutterella wadsworthensis]|jgi:Rha family phage regulatory protein|uniref:Rha family transcriptional regulator n=1 Tax=Sutterella wadsworthensis TaxID=40545 RepID=UPI000DE81850|nr:Rha family transcriptional regulator [Sutterella wadsworthensis]QQS89215.1 Rha family transcriptional regulator [Sutterella wadsworthensis]RBP52350.1 Rha family phage regulatory protein [Sutterella wadsworthensis]